MIHHNWLNNRGKHPWEGDLDGIDWRSVPKDIVSFTDMLIK